MGRDDLLPQETSLRRSQQRMDEAFCDAMFKAIDTGQEFPPAAISTEPQAPKIPYPDPRVNR
jgi:hypothetical protein